MEQDKVKININELNKGNIYSKKVEHQFLFDYIIDIKKYNYITYKFKNIGDFGFEKCMVSTKLYIEKNLNNRFKDNVVISDLDYFCEYLSNIIWEYIVNNFLGSVLTHEYKILKDNLEEYKTLSLIDFIKTITNREEWIIYLYEKYPVLFFIISNFIEEQIDYINEILSNYKKDILVLRKEFGNLNDKIKLIEILKGDPHYLGKSVSFVYTKDKIIVYKPRTLKFEKEMLELLIKNGLESKYPKTLCMGEHGYSEYIQVNNKEQKNNKSNTYEYFYSLGKNCKILHFLQVEDVISDNVIWDGFKHNIIDLECFHIPPINIQSKFKELNQITQLSPIQTGIVSNKVGNKDYNMSLLFENNHYLNKIVDKNNKKGWLNKLNGIKNKHLPSYYMVDNSNFSKYINIFLEGYNSVISENIETNIVDEETRIILRETQTYFDILISSKNPENLISSETYKSYLAIILGSKYNSYPHIKISNFEFEELLKNHIPIFYIKNEGLYNSEKILLINNFYKISDRYLNINTKSDYSVNLREILLSSKNDNYYFDYYFGYIEKENIYSLNFINKLNKYLKYNCCYYNSIPFILSLHNNFDSFKISSKISQFYCYMSPGLLNGTDGFAVSLITNDNVDKDLYDIAYKIINYNYSQIEKHYNNSDLFSETVFDYPLSSVISKVILDKKSNNMINKFIFSILEKKELNYSFINGVSSFILFLKNNNSMFCKKTVNLFLKNIINRIKNDVNIKNNKIYLHNKLIDNSYVWNLNNECLGLLIIINSIRNEIENDIEIKSIRDKLHELLYLYLSNHNYDIINKTSWQYGFNGVISFLMSSKEVKFASIIEKYINILYENYITQNFSLNSGT